MVIHNLNFRSEKDVYFFLLYFSYFNFWVKSFFIFSFTNENDI